MRKLVTINVGLKDNKLNQNEIVEYFKNMYPKGSYFLEKYTFEVGEYKGEKEITFVALLSYTYNDASKVLSDFEKIASVLNQECIAIKAYGLQALAYNLTTKDKSTVFNQEYFYDIIKEHKTNTTKKIATI